MADVYKSGDPLPAAAMRPVLFVDGRAVERYGIFLSHFFTALADRSYRAALVCETECEDKIIVSPAIDVIIHKPSMLPLLCSVKIAELARQLENFNPGILHAMSRTKVGMVRSVAHELQKPYLISLWSFEMPASRNVLDDFCKGVIVPSEDVRRWLAQEFPRIASKIFVVSVGAFVERRTACFSKARRVAGIVVSQPPRRAPDFEPLFAAMQKLLIQGYEFMLVLIGCGAAESDLRKMSEAMGLVGSINFASENSPARQIFSDSDIFVSPVPAEIYNAPMLEAMSVGMAVAGCKGGMDDLLISEETGLVFNRHDPESIYKTLKLLLDKRDYARQLAAKAQSYLRAHHTVTEMMNSLIGVYQTALSDESAPDPTP
jgi:glycosyltransferase involved in cell wall biosynthesis